MIIFITSVDNKFLSSAWLVDCCDIYMLNSTFQDLLSLFLPLYQLAYTGVEGINTHTSRSYLDCLLLHTIYVDHLVRVKHLCQQPEVHTLA